jgi:hypothetical protein
MQIGFIWITIGSSIVLLSVNGRDMAVFRKGKGAGLLKDEHSIGHGVCSVHKLRKLHTKNKMHQLTCKVNFIIRVPEVPYVSVSCVMK